MGIFSRHCTLNSTDRVKKSDGFCLGIKIAPYPAERGGKIYGIFLFF
jgi:hypothetical protein